jgi:hypothetical protein
VNARRREAAAVATDDVTLKGMVDVFMAQHKDSFEILAPVAGAVVGAMALEAASQHVDMKKHEIALLGAGLAFLTGANAKGPMRQLAMGAAAGAACYGMVEVLRQRHPEWLYQQPQRRQAAPADALTRADLENAIGELTRRHQAALAARESEMLEMKQSYEAQIGELRAAVHALLNQLRQERGQPIVEYPPTPTGNDGLPHAIATDGKGLPRASNDNASSNAAPPTIPSSTSLSPEQSGHFAAIYGLLTAEERVRVSAMIAGVSPTLLARVQRDLLSMTPERAVAHLRRNVLPSGVAA